MLTLLRRAHVTPAVSNTSRERISLPPTLPQPPLLWRSRHTARGARRLAKSLANRPDVRAGTATIKCYTTISGRFSPEGWFLWRLAWRHHNVVVQGVTTDS